MKWPWRRLIEAGKLLIDAVKPPTWPPKFCLVCDGRMQQLNGDPDVFVCTGQFGVKGGGCGTWLRRPGTGKQQPELPNQGVHRGDL